MKNDNDDDWDYDYDDDFDYDYYWDENKDDDNDGSQVEISVKPSYWCSLPVSDCLFKTKQLLNDYLESFHVSSVYISLLSF